MTNPIIAAWLVAAMKTWVSITEHSEEAATATARYEELANDYLVVAQSEAPLFKHDDDRLRTLTLLASVESFEGSFAKGKILGDKHPVTKAPRAFCGMQIQPGPTGLVFEGDMWNYAKPGDPEAITGDMLLADHQLCVRMGLHMLRASFRHTGDLGEYTGEGRGGKKSKQRLDRATWWFTNKRKELQES